MRVRLTPFAAIFGALGMAGGLAAPAMAQTAPPAPATPAAPAPAAAAPAAAAPAAPPTVTLNAPGMDGPLSFPTNPYALDVGPLGKWYVDAAVSGLAYAQDHRTGVDTSAGADISNGQVFIQKVDGWWQFYAQLGAYSLPVLGTAYKPNDASHSLNNYYSVVPQAFLKIAITDAFSIMAGKLPTLIGAEYTFTFENFNIERGLMWNQEPAVSRGVQATYVKGPLTFNVSLNDGYYSNHYNWLTASVAYAINPTNTLTFAGGDNFGTTNTTQFATPQAQNNSSIYNIIYTYNSAPWTITPYIQYQEVKTNLGAGIPNAGSEWSGALLVSYAIDSNWSVAGRGEYIHSSGSAAAESPNLTFYGPGSKAWSFTVTPTYQYNRYFARAEFSYVGLSSITDGDGFGSDGNAKNQIRGLLETGILF